MPDLLYIMMALCWSFMGLLYTTMWLGDIVRLLCKVGIHRRIYGYKDGFTHDLFTNKVQGGHYSKTCECGKDIEVKPESKEFIDHFQEIEDAWLTEEHLIQERAMRNLLRGHEIDIVAAEPVHK